MASQPNATNQPVARSRNPRGEGTRLREQIVAAALDLLDELADDQALSLRAVARTVGIAATSVYLHFADRDELVLAVMDRCQADLVLAADRAERAADGPAARLRARLLVYGQWAAQHPGLYKVINESVVNRRNGTSMKSADAKKDLAAATTVAIERCIAAGLARPADPAAVALDLRMAMHGMVSLRVNQPDFPWPSLADQIDRFLTSLVGLAPAAAQTPSRSSAGVVSEG